MLVTREMEKETLVVLEEEKPGNLSRPQVKRDTQSLWGKRKLHERMEASASNPVAFGNHLGNVYSVIVPWELWDREGMQA